MSPTDDNKPASEGPGEKPKRRRRARRPATIDLAATEVTVEAADAEQPETGEKSAQKASAKSEMTGEETKAAETETSEEQEAQPFRPEWTRNTNLALVIFVLGAVLGGIVALGVHGGLVALGFLPGSGQDLAPVEAKIEALKTDLGNEIAGLKSGQSSSDALDALASDVRQLAERLKAVEATLAEIPKADPGPRLADLDDRLGALAARLGDVETATEAGRNEVRGLIEKMASSSDGQAVEAAIAALTRRIDAVEAAAKAEAGRQVAAARAEIVRETDARKADVLQEIAGLRTDVADLRDAVATSATGAPAARAAAALAIASAGLERAVNSGVAFDRELASVEALAGPRDEITALKRYAESGVARRDALTESFQDAASAAMKTTLPQTDGFVDRLIADARRIVRIRPTGEVEGDTTVAIIARAEARLASGDLAAAVEELSALEPAAKQAMAAWIEQAKARLEAERLVSALNEQVLTGLSAGEGTGAQ